MELLRQEYMLTSGAAGAERTLLPEQKKKGAANKKHQVNGYSLPFNGFRITLCQVPMFSQNLCPDPLARFALFHEKQDVLLQLVLSKAPSPCAHAENRQYHSVSGVSPDPGWSQVKCSKAMVAAAFSC